MGIKVGKHVQILMAKTTRYWKSGSNVMSFLQLHYMALPVTVL